ncbi:MAG: tetratricopeptide repeat protein [Verrucomicrobiae bacterium]|nr:tetratricopeptide repeat protein [Verrucomicrobiae bacterium]
MQALQPPDHHHLAAAEGWFELGNDFEAAAEWDRLSSTARQHPAALELRWHIAARRQDWEHALALAGELVARAPGLPVGWLHRAYAFRRTPQGGLQAAWDALLPAAQHFPEERLIAYNLACYAACLGRLDDAWEWFLRASQIAGDARTLRQLALKDPDLEPLWPRIRGLR